MEGELKKWVNIFLGWRKRHFRLAEGVLVYSKNKSDKAIKRIAMNICEISQTPKDSLRIILHSGTKKMLLRAETVSEKINWL